MGKPTDEEIGAACREYWEACGERREDIAAKPSAWRRATVKRRMQDDHTARHPYTTEDLRAALAVEREAEAKSAEPLNLDIWSDEYAPKTDSPLLAGVFGQESTVPEWLNSPSVTTQRPERAQVASGDDIDAELARYGVGEDAPSIFDGVEMPEPTTPEDVAAAIPLRDGCRWEVCDDLLDLYAPKFAGTAYGDDARASGVCVSEESTLYANALALAKHCGALA
jgi:hypothetical protein